MIARKYLSNEQPAMYIEENNRHNKEMLLEEGR